jgi:GNAT superfamily N-acetyltransferase
MHVRQAGPGDLDELARLRARWRGGDPTPDFDAAFRDWFASEGSSRWWWLAEDDAGRPVGMVNVKVLERMPSPAAPGSRWGYLANLFVLPTARLQGTGTALVRAATEFARTQALERLVLAPSEQSRPLYARLGFRPAHELLVHPLLD